MTQASQLPRSTLEAQGISSEAIHAFVRAAEQQGLELHSMMLLRHGQVLAEGWWLPFGPEHPHHLFSLSKSFASTAVGLAVAEGRLAVDDTVLSFFPEDAPAEPGANLAAMRVHHLLSMSTGNDKDTMQFLFAQPEGNWVKGFLAAPVEHEPGTHFAYNSGATYMLSAIVQKLTGMTLLDYLRPRLLDPLGIEQATWQSDPRGINVGGWGLSITTESIARFGQLYLQRGMWNGKQLMPAEWVAAATSAQVPNGSNPESDWNQGYGYQFWRCRHNAYRGDGAFGQFCLVMPDQDAVLALTSAVDDMQAELDLVWKHLLPAMQAAPLPENPAAQEQLRQKLASLAYPPPEGAATSATAARVSGTSYSFEPNTLQITTITWDFAGENATLALTDERGTHHVTCGFGTWLPGTSTLDPNGARKITAAGAWRDEHTYVAQFRFYETPHMATMTCRFNENQLLLDFVLNASFGPTDYRGLRGTAEK